MEAIKIETEKMVLDYCLENKQAIKSLSRPSIFRKLKKKQSYIS